MCYIGIDLGGTNIAAGIVDENYKIIAKDKVPTRAERPADEIVRDMAALCTSLVDRMGLSFDDIAYIGIAAPGAIDPVNGVVKYANNLKMFQYPMAERMKALLPVKRVCLENDANAATLAEAKVGAGKGCDDVIMITLGTGVGGGIVIGGKLYSGFNYMGAELGHIGIEAGGRQCSCGRRGCWEAYSSATALVRFTKEKLAECKDTVMWDMCKGNVENASGRTAFDASKKGDCAGQEVVDTYIEYLAYGITNLVNIFQPQVLCIGGGVCGEGDYLLNPLKALVDRDQYGTNAHDDKTELKIAELGNDAGILGAALLGL